MPPVSMRKVVVTSWDDGSRADLRVGALLRRYALKGTFFVITNGITGSLGTDGVLNLSQDFEVGSHTKSHVPLTALGGGSVSRELAESKAVIERIIGKEVSSLSYPFGLYDDRVVEAARKAGYDFGRTYTPYHFAAPRDPLRVDVGVWAQPHGLLYSHGPRSTFDVLRLLPGRLALRRVFATAMALRSWDELAMTLFDVFLGHYGVFHLVGHSWWIDRHDQWAKLEGVLSHIANRPGIDYMTMEEFCRGRISPIP